MEMGVAAFINADTGKATDPLIQMSIESAEAKALETQENKERLKKIYGSIQPPQQPQAWENGQWKDTGRGGYSYSGIRDVYDE